MEKFKHFIETNMFWILVVITVPVWLFSGSSWNVNRTIGWGWDFTQLISWGLGSLTSVLLVAATGYGILYVTKRKAHFGLSALLLVLILLRLLVLFDPPVLSGLLTLLTWIVFLLNMLLSRKNLKAAVR